MFVRLQQTRLRGGGCGCSKGNEISLDDVGIKAETNEVGTHRPEATVVDVAAAAADVAAEAEATQTEEQSHTFDASELTMSSSNAELSPATQLPDKALVFDGRAITIGADHCRSVAQVKALLEEHLGLQIVPSSQHLWACGWDCDGRRAQLRGLPDDDDDLPVGPLNLLLLLE
eukprot:650993-Prymnesium_polylepis.1